MRVFSLSLASFGLGNTVDEFKTRPVTKVINLLKQMQKQLEEDAVNDKEIFDKFKCWCTTNEKEKVESIKIAGEQIEQLKTDIEEYLSNEKRLMTEIADLEEEIDKNQKALDSATAIRRKEVAAMNSNEKDLIKYIRALKSAIISLKKHNALVQMGSVMDIATLLEHPISKSALSPSQKRLVHSFIEESSGAPGGFKSHASQSGQIFGILGGMLDTFEANLKTSQREEAEAQRIFEELKKAKTELIQAGQKQVNRKNEELAATRVSHAEAVQNLEDTEASKAADEAFLKDLRERCTNMDAEWAQRQKNRAEEQVSVAEALKILSSDEVHDLFTSTFNPDAPTAFTQLTTKSNRAQASKILNKAAARYHNPKIASLAVTVRLDAFTKVKKAIDDMMAQLAKEKEDEIKHKDWCNENFHQNQNSRESTQRNINEHTAAIDGLEAEIKTLDNELQVLRDEVGVLQVEQQRASEARKVQNAEFKHVISEQRATQRVLTQAINVLKDVFHRKEKARFAELQKDEPVGPPPPEGFKTYAKNKDANPVIVMVQQIIDEAKNMEQETTMDERDAQEAYERFTKETTRSLDEKNKSIINKTEIRAQKDMSKEENQSALDKENSEMESLMSQKSDLHQSCDFVLKNFDARQDARDAETESLRQAKAILSGSGAGAGFLQRY
jgi:nitrogen regulatory protein PII-like uncharacterized protein